jgi:hypothetical protein
VAYLLLDGAAKPVASGTDTDTYTDNAMMTSKSRFAKQRLVHTSDTVQLRGNFPEIGTPIVDTGTTKVAKPKKKTQRAQ